MTSQYRHRRFSDPTKTFVALEPGEIGVNTANRQLTVGDSATGVLGAPLALLPIRIFDTRAIYTTNDYVIYNGVIYRAKSDVGLGAFNPTFWDVIAGQAAGTAPYVVRTGDTMTGPLVLPAAMPNSNEAVRRDVVDTLLAPYATQSYVTSALVPYATQAFVNTQDAKAVQKTGDTMTGPLALSGNPTVSTHASNKAYVDSQVALNSGMPPGAVADFAMPTAPAGWLVCDGQAISRTTYAALYAAIGNTWGGGDGTTTFNVPNFRTRYRRHRDDNASFASTVGTYQNPCNLSHTHNVSLNTGYVSADHAHYTSGTTNAADRNLDHLHGGVPQQSGNYTVGTVIASGAGQYVNNADGNSGAADRSIDHLHTYGAWSGGASANHYHYVGGDTGGGSADNANESRPYSATVLTCIKV